MVRNARFTTRFICSFKYSRLSHWGIAYVHFAYGLIYSLWGRRRRNSFRNLYTHMIINSFVSSWIYSLLTVCVDGSKFFIHKKILDDVTKGRKSSWLFFCIKLNVDRIIYGNCWPWTFSVDYLSILMSLKNYFWLLSNYRWLNNRMVEDDTSLCIDLS